MTGAGPADGLPSLLARLLTAPDLLDALDRRDLAMLRRELTDVPEHLAAITAMDVAGFRFYLRRLQRKRLEGIENIFPASLPAARRAYGADALAAEFWRWYQPPATAAAHEVPGLLVTAWTELTERLARRGPLGWLGDLSRYEVMRWRAYTAAPRPELPQEQAGNPVFAPGTGVGTFAVDPAELLRTAADGSPVPSRVTTRLITWHVPPSGIQTARLGAAVYEAVLACDGSRTTDQAAARASAGRPDACPRLAAALRDLVQAGALRLSAWHGPAEQQQPGVVQPADGG